MIRDDFYCPVFSGDKEFVMFWGDLGLDTSPVSSHPEAH